jgi:hypothetical protein
MATVNGVNYTKYLANEGNWIDQGKVKDFIHVDSDTYEASALAQGSTIAMGTQLPAGAIIHGITLAFDDLGTGVTIDVGDSNDADRYKDGVDVSTAAGSDTGVLVDGLGYVIGTNTGDNIILVTIVGATGVTATGTIKLTTFYTN